MCALHSLASFLLVLVTSLKKQLSIVFSSGTCHPHQKAGSQEPAFSFGGVGLEPQISAKFRFIFLKYSQNARSAQPHFIFPYFSYALGKNGYQLFFLSATCHPNHKETTPFVQFMGYRSIIDLLKKRLDFS